MHKRNNSTHEVLPPSDSLAELLKDVCRARQGEIRVLADNKVPQAAHAGEAVAEADDGWVNGRWSLRAHLRHLQVRRTVVNGHVELLESGAVLNDIEEPRVGTLCTDTPHPTTQLRVPPEALCKQGCLLVRAKGDVAVESGSRDPEPCSRDEEGSDVRRNTEFLEVRSETLRGARSDGESKDALEQLLGHGGERKTHGGRCMRVVRRGEGTSSYSR